MKWNLTLRFVTSIILVVIIVVMVNVVAMAGVYLGYQSYVSNTESLEKYGPEAFVRSFGDNIISDDNGVAVSSDGENLLEQSRAWIQVLDENGREVYQYGKPDSARLKYSPVDIVSFYKNRGGLNIFSTMYIGEKIISQSQYSYIIGLPMDKYDKVIFTYDIDKAGQLMRISLIVMLVIDLIIALFAGYLFTRSLTEPLSNIMDAVEGLGEGRYNEKYTPTGIYKDVYSNLNNLSDALKKNENEQKKLDQMREEWIANISHDIKTPLASILGYAEIIGDDEYEISGAEVRAYARIMHNKSKYIASLVDDLNLIMRLKNNSQMMNRSEVNLVKLIRNVVIDILNDPKHSDRCIDFDSSDEEVWFNVDETLIRRAISNLLYNALIHNEKKVKIEVGIFSDQKVHILVKDNGKGIDEEDLNHIFERYFRGTNTGESHKGSGLGLAISKDIVEAHGGSIRMVSSPGVGTKAEVIL